LILLKDIKEKNNHKMKAALISLRSKSSKMTIEAMQKYFDEVEDIYLKNVEVNLGTKGAQVLYDGEPLKEYDCVFVKGSFRYVTIMRAITSALQGKCYLPIKDPAFTEGHDKFITQLKLQTHNVPMPTTYLSSTDTSKKILEKISYPIVMKLPSGTQGKGIMFADSYSSASSMLDALAAMKQPFLIQEYVECDDSDIRAFVVGDKVIAAMKRKAEKGEKRANIHAGGHGEAYEMDNYSKKIAIKAAEAMGADICGVDILESVKGPMVIEVNLSPGLQGITETTKIDVADKVAKFLFEKTEEYTKKHKDTKTDEIFKDLGIGEVEPQKEIITNLDFRSDRIMLPKVVTDVTQFNERQDVQIKARKGKLIIDKFDVKE